MEINQIFIDYKTEIKIVDHAPTISWNLKGKEKDIYQKAYKIELFRDSERIYDTDIVKSDECIGIKLPIKILPFSNYKLTLTVVDISGNISTSDAFFKTGRMDLPWSAKWIGGEAAETQTASVKKKYPIQRREHFFSERNMSLLKDQFWPTPFAVH